MIDYIGYLGAESNIINVKEILQTIQDDTLLNKIMATLARYPAMQTIIDEYQMKQKLRNH